MNKTMKFEAAVEKLEALVRKLEGGDLTLEDSLKAFEEGIGLARVCEARLKEAKGKIEKLIQKENNLWSEEPMDLGES